MLFRLSGNPNTFCDSSCSGGRAVKVQAVCCLPPVSHAPLSNIPRLSCRCLHSALARNKTSQGSLEKLHSTEGSTWGRQVSMINDHNYSPRAPVCPAMRSRQRYWWSRHHRHCGWWPGPTCGRGAHINHIPCSCRPAVRPPHSLNSPGPASTSCWLYLVLQAGLV